MDDNDLDLPPDEPLPGSDRILPYFFVADNAFPLGRHLMKPFPGKGLNQEERVYNYRYELLTKMSGVYGSSSR